MSPGHIRIDNLLTGETDVSLGAKFKVKFSRDGKKFFDFIFDEENLSAKILYKDRMLIIIECQYKDIATFIKCKF